jgi:hypothetical protein
MITIDGEKKVFLKTNGTELCFNKEEEYKKIVILLTDPLVTKLTADDFAVDSQLSGEDKALCSRYSAVLREYWEYRSSDLEG